MCCLVGGAMLNAPTRRPLPIALIVPPPPRWVARLLAACASMPLALAAPMPLPRSSSPSSLSWPRPPGALPVVALRRILVARARLLLLLHLHVCFKRAIPLVDHDLQRQHRPSRKDHQRLRAMTNLRTMVGHACAICDHSLWHAELAARAEVPSLIQNIDFTKPCLSCSP